MFEKPVFQLSGISTASIRAVKVSGVLILCRRCMGLVLVFGLRGVALGCFPLARIRTVVVWVRVSCVLIFWVWVGCDLSELVFLNFLFSVGPEIVEQMCCYLNVFLTLCCKKVKQRSYRGCAKNRSILSDPRAFLNQSFFEVVHCFLVAVVALRGALFLAKTQCFFQSGGQRKSESRFLFKSPPRRQGSVLILVRSYSYTLTV